MAKIEDLKNLDLKKVKPDELKSAIEKILEDYRNEEDKAGFEKEAKKNIAELFQLIQVASPEAIIKKSPKAVKDKGEKPLGHKVQAIQSAIALLREVYENYEGDDLVGILENTISELDNLSGGKITDNELPKAVSTAVDPLLKFEETIEQNQRLRHGAVVEEDIPVRLKVISIIKDLLKQVGKEVFEKKKTKKQHSALTKKLVRTVIDELTDQAIDLDGEDETIVSGTRLNLEDALNLDDDTKFENAVKKEATEMENWVDDISNMEIRKQIVLSINKLLKALGKPKIETSEEKKAKSKKVLEKVKEYDADIEACRAVIREYNKKKKESEPPKPKPTRLTKLKNHIAAIIKLTPPAIEGDEKVQEGNRKGSELILNHFMPLWGMNQVKQAKSSMKKELDEMEEKIEGKEQKELAQRWKHDLPDTDKIIAYEKKNNKHLLEEAALQIVDHIGESIKLYKDDKSKAFKFLKERFNQNQLNEYLPKYILDELKEEKKK